MYNDNLLREKWENPLVSIVMVPEQKAYAVFNDNWDILYESIIRTGQRNLLKQSPLVKIIEVDQSPIGRTPRSYPATYTGVFTEIRNLFSSLSESKIRGFKQGVFSFNVKGGRCEDCKGGGL